jgi:thiol-disulfide isomerase/thioredoxin
MKNFILLLIIISACSCQTNKKLDFDYINTQFKIKSNEINTIAYNIRRIDTFPGGNVWNHTGNAIIEKNSNDSILGISFFGKRDDVTKDYIYKNTKGFEYSNEDKTLELRTSALGFRGSPGGQMVYGNLFHLDSVYKSIEITESDTNYILKYEFEDDTTYNVTNRRKTIELDKQTFLPTRGTTSLSQLSHNVYGEVILSDIKINDDVATSINKLQEQYIDYAQVIPKTEGANPILNTKLPQLQLTNLMSGEDQILSNSNKMILLDFWEVWCDPCIASFPKVEALKNKYSEHIEVIGIVSQEVEDAKKLINAKKTTFTNLIGSKELEKQFRINSWPRYFLITKNGTITNEYFGYSEQIEKDIKSLITSK